ncbi:unnamed protein product [Adineta steineri]|uniref:Uncharacterized protein n=1 Tax=Adineta steineri TaxID=433720 RepID=A0A815UPP2_9BILA|nr:unnamed protein product [Adineta steineri]CAF1520069.1 unnamed protein product [Adineta steineri]
MKNDLLLPNTQWKGLPATGIRVQRVQQEVNLSFIRLVYQFYTVVGNALEDTGTDKIAKSDTNTDTNGQKIILLFLHLKMIFKLLF